MEFDLTKFVNYEAEFKSASSYSEPLTNSLIVSYNNKTPRMAISSDLYEKIGKPEFVNIRFHFRSDANTLFISRPRGGQIRYPIKLGKLYSSKRAYLTGMKNLLEELFVRDIVTIDSTVVFKGLYDKETDGIFVDLDSKKSTKVV